MKQIKLGNTEVKILGTPMTAYHYKKAFGQSFSGDLMALQRISEDQSAFDDINLLQMIWAMAKTCDKNIKPFVNWLEEIEFLNLGDVIDEVTEEAMDATFRGIQSGG